MTEWFVVTLGGVARHNTILSYTYSNTTISVEEGDCAKDEHH